MTSTTITVAAISRKATIPVWSERRSVAFYAVAGIVAVMLAPLSFLVGLWMLGDPGLFDRFGRRTLPSEDLLQRLGATATQPLEVEVTTRRAVRAYSIQSGTRGIFLVQTASDDWFAVPAMPPGLTRERLRTRWTIYSQADSGVFVGTRVYGAKLRAEQKRIPQLPDVSVFRLFTGQDLPTELREVVDSGPFR